jgi:hypothetical protein
MKFFYLIIFLLFFSCGTVKKDYVCGDHLCVDKKEFNEYFSKNLIIEVKPKENKKNRNIDLVNLNTNTLNKKKDNKILKKEMKIKKKKEKERVKAEKIRILNDRKIKDIDERNKKKEKVIVRSSIFGKKNKKEINNKITNNRDLAKENSNKTASDKKKKPLVESKEIFSNDTKKTINTTGICDEIKDCDIDTITELLIQKGRNKPFPDITTN